MTLPNKDVQKVNGGQFTAEVEGNHAPEVAKTTGGRFIHDEGCETQIDGDLVVGKNVSVDGTIELNDFDDLKVGSEKLSDYIKEVVEEDTEPTED